MITLNAVFARMRRQKIEEFSGEFFLCGDDVIETIPSLRRYEEQQFLFGIYFSEERWTILSVNYLYALCDKRFSTLRLDEEADIVCNYFCNNDFSSEVHLDDGRSIWMKSPELSSLILNLMLMLKKVPCETRLK
ncbi:hypothetical protein [Pleionea sp. CnH1-48]|uniref:hypothetical protein n=1 Tax=Pleionea sp. CnH1-48 TaxID=2954494 RepID=UPI002096D180|nr:hypothetical protein [Pleionea sp. CnH1-48]MCO7225789.1 hypothetical protein [Pleionea sp. CnH1-48]